MYTVILWGAIVYAIRAYISDKHNARFLTMVVCAPIGIAGYAILLCDVPAAVAYFATYLIATACFLCTGTNNAWLTGNCAPDGKRAASLGILLALTNIGGVVSGQIYQTKAAPLRTRRACIQEAGCAQSRRCGRPCSRTRIDLRAASFSSHIGGTDTASKRQTCIPHQLSWGASGDAVN